MPKAIQITCPKCGGIGEVKSSDPAHEVLCCHCGKVFTYKDLYVVARRRTMEVESELTSMALVKKGTILTGLTTVVSPKIIDNTRPDLLRELKGRIIGQDHVLQDITSTFYRWELGLSSEEQPAGSFLFMGPTGVGKTRVCEALSEILLGSSKTLIKIDCAEFQHSHEVAKLIGSPPGYLGHRETQPALTQSKLNSQWTEKNKCSLILFDEVEKASDALWNLLLGILDKAVLTLGDNSKVDFSSTFIFLTSNIGAREMQSAVNGAYGFQGGDGKVATVSQDKLKSIALDAAKRRFAPEFLNRLDTKVVFHSLSKASLESILDQQLNLLQKRILRGLGANGFVLEVSEDCREFLLTEGFSKVYGARELKRTIGTHLTDKLAHLIHEAPEEWMNLESVRVQMGEGKCQFVKVK